MKTEKSIMYLKEKTKDKNGGRLKDVLNNNELEVYDFKKEMKLYYEQYKMVNPNIINTVLEAVPYLDESLSSVEQFFKYRTADNEIARRFYSRFDTSIKPFDCDSSQLAEEIYQLLWNYDKKKGDWYGRTCLNGNAYLMGSDTMNSFQTIFNLVMNDEFLDKENEYYEEILLLLNEFAKTTHTLGNFVLVPAGFNKFRYAPTKDFMDASLVILKNEEYTNSTNESFFNKEMFPVYVNQMFLFDYVHKKDGEYEINSLFNPMLNLEQDRLCWLDRLNTDNFELYMFQYLKRICVIIYRRSLLMGFLLKCKLSDDPIKKEISVEMSQFLNSDTYLNTKHDDGYVVILNKFKEILSKKGITESELHEELRVLQQKLEKLKIELTKKY